jgi:hypothetical protein
MTHKVLLGIERGTSNRREGRGTVVAPRPICDNKSAMQEGVSTALREVLKGGRQYGANVAQNE